MPEHVYTDLTPDDVGRIVLLVYGITATSQPFWCFVAVKPSRYKELQKQIADKIFDIRVYEADGYGEIVVSGEGVTPPNDVVKTVAKMFDVPVRKLFSDTDPDKAINIEVERLKRGSIL